MPLKDRYFRRSVPLQPLRGKVAREQEPWVTSIVWLEVVGLTPGLYLLLVGTACNRTNRAALCSQLNSSVVKVVKSGFQSWFGLAFFLFVFRKKQTHLVELDALPLLPLSSLTQLQTYQLTDPSPGFWPQTKVQTSRVLITITVSALQAPWLPPDWIRPLELCSPALESSTSATELSSWVLGTARFFYCM